MLQLKVETVLIVVGPVQLNTMVAYVGCGQIMKPVMYGAKLCPIVLVVGTYLPKLSSINYLML